MRSDGAPRHFASFCVRHFGQALWRVRHFGQALWRVCVTLDRHCGARQFGQALGRPCVDMDRHRDALGCEPSVVGVGKRLGGSTARGGVASLQCDVGPDATDALLWAAAMDRHRCVPSRAGDDRRRRCHAASAQFSQVSQVSGLTRSNSHKPRRRLLHLTRRPDWARLGPRSPHQQRPLRDHALRTTALRLRCQKTPRTAR
jgi:hypothetical protein